MSERKSFTNLVRENDVLTELVKEYLRDNDSPPDFLFGVVRKIINHKNKVYTSNDPFYSVEDNKQRVEEGGRMKSPLDREYAFVEIEGFFEYNNSSNDYLIDTLLRVEIPKDEKIQLNEIIKVKFLVPQFYERPVFDGRPRKKAEFKK